jgi:MFS family permease
MGKIDKNIIYLGWVSYFTDMASAMITPILPIFVVSVLHEGYDKLGIIVAVATFISYALRLVSGYISDRYGIVKPLVVSGYLLSALSKPLIAFSHGYKSVALLRGLERLGKGVRSAPKDLLISIYAKRKEEGKTFGFHKTMDIAGELSGTLLVFGLLYFFGQSETILRNIFLATLIPGVIGVFIVIFLVKDAPKERQIEYRFALTKHDRDVIKNLFFYFLFLLFIFSDAFFTMRAKTAGFETFMIPLLFVVSTATQTLVSYPVGKLIDRYGVKYLLIFAYASGVAAQLMLLWGTSLAIWIAYALLGMFTVVSLNANRAYIARYATNRGSVYGVFYAGVALFGAIGALACGSIWEYISMHAALTFSLYGTLLVLLIYLFFGGGKDDLS